MGAPIRIAIADDHAILREGLKALLGARPDLKIVGEAERVDEIVPLLAHGGCDVLLLDLQMDRSSLGVIETLSKLVAVVVLTISESEEDVLAAVQGGARAVVFKRFAPETLLEAIWAAARGHLWIPPSLQPVLHEALRGPRRERLSPREREIVELVSRGLRNAEVALKLGIREQTVKKHLNTIFHKIGVRDRVELALYAIRMGLVTVHEGPRRPGPLPRKL